MRDQTEQIFSMTTNALLLHMNTGQLTKVNTSSVIFLLEKLILDTLSNKTIQLNHNSQVRFPSTLNIDKNQNVSISYRVIFP